MTTIDLRGNNIKATRFTGPLTGAVTGNVTGNVTGDVTGDVTGASVDANGLTSTVINVETTVDCSVNGTATEKAVATIPAGSVLLNVKAEVLVAFNGDTTTTAEVGVSGNIDAYIDSVDFDPGAAVGTVAGSASGTNNDVKYSQYLATATDVILTYTNSASATAGSILVTLSYIQVA
jgi:hypothetical protein